MQEITGIGYCSYHIKLLVDVLGEVVENFEAVKFDEDKPLSQFWIRFQLINDLL